MKNLFIGTILFFCFSFSLFANEKVVLITGSTGGLGEALVNAFEAQGWSVWCGYLTKPTRGLINRNSIDLIRLDVTDTRSIETAVATIIKKQGRIDAIVNNAGYELIGAEECLSIEDSQKLFDVNFFGSLRLIQAVAPHMRTQLSGHIINISCLSGMQAVPGLGMYAASKFALEGLSESLAVTLSPWNIQVSLVEPGMMDNQWVSHCKKGSKKLSEPLYNNLQDALMTRLSSLALLGQSCFEVAELIVQIAENPKPDFRYQTSDNNQAWVKKRRVDPSGNQMKEESLLFFQSLVDSPD